MEKKKNIFNPFPNPSKAQENSLKDTEDISYIYKNT